MKRFLIPVTLLIILPSLVYASVDFTKVVTDNAMLLLFLASVLLLVGAAVGKILWNNMEKKLEEQTKKAEDNKEEVHAQAIKSKEQEIIQLKTRIDRIENDQSICARALPVAYVTRAEYDKFVVQHRVEFTSLMNKMENVIKEFRNEIKTDVQVQIDRVITILSDKLV